MRFAEARKKPVLYSRIIARRQQPRKTETLAGEVMLAHRRIAWIKVKFRILIHHLVVLRILE